MFCNLGSFSGSLITLPTGEVSICETTKVVAFWSLFDSTFLQIANRSHDEISMHRWGGILQMETLR